MKITLLIVLIALLATSQSMRVTQHRLQQSADTSATRFQQSADTAATRFQQSADTSATRLQQSADTSATVRQPIIDFIILRFSILEFITTLFFTLFLKSD